MFEVRWLMLLIPALPLLSAIVIAVLGPRLLRESSHRVAIACLGLSFLCSLGVVRHIASQHAASGPGGYEHLEVLWRWVDVPEALTLPTPDGSGTHTVPFRLDVTLRADALTGLMLPMVTFIATLVAIYASGYMHGDPGYWRFFCYVSLFVFSMTMLVLVSNFMLLFVFWEAVGLCSYLLIGFWYQKPEAAAAGKKAFLVNRIGDFGFALALFLIWTNYGTLNFHDTTDVAGVFGVARITHEMPYVQGGIATAIALLLMLGACGKSAQFPLHVWLPDAMEGPTPVSALIHAATMVTAGVYMVARCTPLFVAAPQAQLIVATIGGFTAVLAGLIALTQFDLKRVLAYSTVSQLGYMFLALGTGTLTGITAGMFHLFTHAFFKALLFLGAGSVMHAMGHVIDMRRFGGLRHVMPWTHRTFLVGCLALSGVFPFAGFWSKDQIIASVHDQFHAAHTETPDVSGENAKRQNHVTQFTSSTTQHGISSSTTAWETQRSRVFRWLYAASLLTAFMTAFYTFRAYFLTFFGEERIPEEAGHHAHESPPAMCQPLMILAVFAFGVGFVWELNDTVARFLSSAPSLAYLVPPSGFEGVGFHMNIALISSAIALAGVALSAFLYLGNRHEVEVLSKRLSWLRQLSYHKFFIDEIYNTLIVWPLRIVGLISYWIDRYVVDGLVNGSGRIPVALGGCLRQVQTGLVPLYGLMMVVGMLILLGLGGWFWWGA